MHRLENVYTFDYTNNAVMITKTMPERFPFFEQFTEEQMKTQYRRNAEGLTKMADKAVRTGKKVNGYRPGELVVMAIQFDFYAQNFQR